MARRRLGSTRSDLQHLRFSDPVRPCSPLGRTIVAWHDSPWWRRWIARCWKAGARSDSIGMEKAL